MTPEQIDLWERIERNSTELKASITMRQMNDALNEASAKEVAEFDQEWTATENLGRVVALYYRTLREEGLPKGIASNLVMDYQGYCLSRMDR